MKGDYIAIIPARGGSKGIRDKNLQQVGGLSLVAHAIKVSKQMTQIVRIIVSTDSNEIAQEAIRHGATVHRRSLQNATDTAKTIDVIFEIMQDCQITDDICILLQPTSPLRQVQDIQQCIDQFEQQKRLGSVVSISEAEHHPYKMLINTTNGLKPIHQLEDLSTPRQQLEPAFRVNGSIYIARFEDLLKHNSFFFEPQSFVQISKRHSLDIDDEVDLKLANIIWATL